MDRRTSMRFWFSAVVLFAACATRTGGADDKRPAPPATATATFTFTPSAGAGVYQSSYDDEATGKNDAALADLDRLPAAQQGSYVTLLRRGWLLAKLGKNAEAADAYAKATAAEPSSVEARLGALPVLAATRRWNDVEATARQVLERDPGSYVANLRLAFALYSLGRFPEAEVVYRRLATLYPGDVEVRAGMGWSLFKMGKADDAAKVFADILEVAPKNALALDGLKLSRAGK